MILSSGSCCVTPTVLLGSRLLLLRLQQTDVRAWARDTRGERERESQDARRDKEKRVRMQIVATQAAKAGFGPVTCPSSPSGVDVLLVWVVHVVLIV